MSKSIMNTTAIRGPLGSQGLIRPNGNKMKKDLQFSLNLTALIDTFSILVIFLLTIFNGDAQPININSHMVLPKATKMELMTMGTIIRVDNGQYFIDETAVPFNKIVEKLIQTKMAKKDLADDVKNSLIIQADRSLSFEQMSPIIRAGGQAGFNQYKFAVLPSEHNS